MAANTNFIRGTTPTHIFQLSIKTNTIQQLRITYRQFGRTVLEITEEDVTMGTYEIKYTMTQEQSLKFNPGFHVDVQVKIMTNVGTVLASPIMRVSVGEILNTEVLT